MDVRTQNWTRASCAKWGAVRGICLWLKAAQVPGRGDAGDLRFGDLRERDDFRGDLPEAIGEERAASPNRNLLINHLLSTRYGDSESFTNMETTDFERHEKT